MFYTREWIPVVMTLHIMVILDKMQWARCAKANEFLVPLIRSSRNGLKRNWGAMLTCHVCVYL